MSYYKVMVDTLGQVYVGNNLKQATRTFEQYQSEAVELEAYDSVTLLRDGDPIREYLSEDE
jgi:hypothetical protein